MAEGNKQRAEKDVTLTQVMRIDLSRRLIECAAIIEIRIRRLRNTRTSIVTAACLSLCGCSEHHSHSNNVGALNDRREEVSALGESALKGAVFTIIKHAPALRDPSLEAFDVRFAVWPDGRVFCNGPTPHYLSVQTNAILSLLAAIEAAGFFDTSHPTSRAWYGQDAPYVEVAGVKAGTVYRLQSWHEFFETNAQVVVVNGVVHQTTLSSRGQLLRERSRDYLEFLALWQRVKIIKEEFCRDHAETYE